MQTVPVASGALQAFCGVHRLAHSARAPGIRSHCRRSHTHANMIMIDHSSHIDGIHSNTRGQNSCLVGATSYNDIYLHNAQIGLKGQAFKGCSPGVSGLYLWLFPYSSYQQGYSFALPSILFHSLNAGSGNGANLKRTSRTLPVSCA